jgi:hypothetical protein
MSGNVASAGQTTAFDDRLLSVQIAVNGQLLTFNQDFWITVKGEKFANALENTCHIEIANLNTAHRNFILTETSPFNSLRVPKVCSVFAGRVSTGMFLVYTGDVMTSRISQPPDIKIGLKCGTCHFKKGSVGRRTGGKSAKLSTLANGVAGNLGLSLRMESPDMNVGNYAYSGNALNEVDLLGKSGNCLAYVDDQQLILKPISAALSGSVLNLSEQTGMIGLPEITDKGLKVKFLYDSSVKLGGAIVITSVLNPAANGKFVIYKLRFDLASRENPFHYEAECLKAA